MDLGSSPCGDDRFDEEVLVWDCGVELGEVERFDTGDEFVYRYLFACGDVVDGAVEVVVVDDLVEVASPV